MNKKEKIKKILPVLPGLLLIVVSICFLSFGILNFVIAEEYGNHADRCVDLGDKQHTGAVTIEEGKAQFVELANEQYQLNQVDFFDCWKYPLWKVGLLTIESPYTTYSKAVRGQLGEDTMIEKETTCCEPVLHNGEKYSQYNYSEARKHILQDQMEK